MEARHAPKRQRTAAAAQQQQQQQQPAAARSSSAVQPAAAGSSGAGGAGDLHSLLLSREQLLAALPLERALQGGPTWVACLSCRCAAYDLCCCMLSMSANAAG